MTRDDAFYWAAISLGTAMVAAFVFRIQEVWLLFGGIALALFGAGHGTIEKLTVNKDGIVAMFQVKALREAMRHARAASESLTLTDAAEAKVTRGAEFTADAVLSPGEFIEVLGAVSTEVHVVFEGGPNDGRDGGWYPARTSDIGASERVDGELRAARGTYQPTGRLDPEGRSVFAWTPLPPDAEA